MFLIRNAASEFGARRREVGPHGHLGLWDPIRENNTCSRLPAAPAGARGTPGAGRHSRRHGSARGGRSPPRRPPGPPAGSSRPAAPVPSAVVAPNVPRLPVAPAAAVRRMAASRHGSGPLLGGKRGCERGPAACTAIPRPVPPLAAQRPHRTGSPSPAAHPPRHPLAAPPHLRRRPPSNSSPPEPPALAPHQRPLPPQRSV